MSKARRDTEVIRSKYPHKYKVLCEAMEKSHGKIDNSITEALFHIPDEKFTVELLLNTAMVYDKEIQLDHYHRDVYEERFWDITKSKKMSIYEKEQRDLNKHTYKFEDTFLYRKIQSAGFKTNPMNEYDQNYTYNTLTDTTRARGSTWGMVSIASKKKNYRSDNMLPLHLFFNLTKSTREFIISDAVWEKMWFEFGTYRTNDVPSYGPEPDWLTQEEWDAKKKDYIIREWAWIANAPEDLLEKTKEALKKQTEQGRNINNYTETLWRATERKTYKGYEPKEYMLFDEAYDIMDYLGIGVMVNPEKISEYWTDFTYGIKKIHRKMAGAVKRFRADVKKGFDIKDARELLIEDLNMFSSTQLRNQWVFYERVDAPETYADIPVKKKKVAKKEED